MDVETLARKLEPLMPEQVERWLRVRDTAEPELKGRIERQITHTAYQVLGDFRKKLLLSLPPKHVAQGRYDLGTIVYQEEKWPLGLKASEVLQNVAIFGRSGAGKTNLVFHLLQQFVREGVPFVFLDWKRTARHLWPFLKTKVGFYTAGRSLSPLPFNPFVTPPGTESHVYIGQLVDVLADAYTLGDGARRLLQKAISRCYEQGNTSPTASEVIEEIERLGSTGREAEWKITALRALDGLSFAKLSPPTKVSQEDMVRQLTQRSSIVELDGLSHNSKKFLIPLLCYWLYSVRLAAPQREELKLVIVLEEAHHVLLQGARGRETLLEQLLRQCRELGVAFLVVDQHPSLLSRAALGNTYASIVLNQKDPSDINKAGALCLLSDSERKHLSMLSVGQAVVKLQDRWRRPVLIHCPHVRLVEGAVTDEVAKKVLDGSVKMSRLRRELEEKQKSGKRFQIGDTVLSDDELRFLQDVLSNEDDSVRDRYQRLAMGVGKGHRIKSRLVDYGVLKEHEVRTGRTWKTLLRVPNQVRTALGLKCNQEAGSVTHEYWKRLYAARLTKQGFKVEFEAPRHGGRVDLLAIRKDERIGIEIETGKSDVVSNVRNGLLSGFNRIYVIATSEEALLIVERKLARAGFLSIRSRVKVILRDSVSFRSP